MAYRRYRRSLRRSLRRASRFARYTRRFQGNQLAVLQQRDVANFNVKARVGHILGIGAGQQYVTYAMNIWALLGENPQYTALTTLFDQVKIRGVSISAVCTYNPNDASQRSIAAYAWDRNGIEAFGDHEQRFTAICTYGSSRQITLGNSTGNRFRTYIVAQDIQERSQYLSTDDSKIVSPFSRVGETFFKPMFYIGVFQPYSDTVTKEYIWQFEVSVDLTLRGTRYSLPRPT